MPPGPRGFRTHLPRVRAGPLRKEGGATCSPHSGTSSYPLAEPGALNQTGRAEVWAARPVGAHGPRGSPAGLQVGAGDQEVLMGLSTLGTPSQAGRSGLGAQGSVPGGVGSDRGLTVPQGPGGLVHIASCPDGVRYPPDPSSLCFCRTVPLLPRVSPHVPLDPGHPTSDPRSSWRRGSGGAGRSGRDRA